MGTKKQRTIKINPIIIDKDLIKLLGKIVEEQKEEKN